MGGGGVLVVMQQNELQSKSGKEGREGGPACRGVSRWRQTPPSRHGRGGRPSPPGARSGLLCIFFFFFFSNRLGTSCLRTRTCAHCARSAILVRTCHSGAHLSPQSRLTRRLLPAHTIPIRLPHPLSGPARMVSAWLPLALWAALLGRTSPQVAPTEPQQQPDPLGGGQEGGGQGLMSPFAEFLSKYPYNARGAEAVGAGTHTRRSIRTTNIHTHKAHTYARAHTRIHFRCRGWRRGGTADCGAGAWWWWWWWWWWW